MTIFATRSRGMKLIINGKSIAKEMKNFKFWAKPMSCTSKESLEQVEIKFRFKEYDLLEKKIFCQLFLFFHLWCCNGKIFISFSIFQNFQKFFQIWLQWGLQDIERNKVMTFELIWGIHHGVKRDCLYVRAQSAHPHVVQG